MWTRNASSILRSLAGILDTDILRVCAGLMGKLVQPVLARWYPGTYEVLEHRVTLELKDVWGKKAIYRKHQRIRFTQDNVIALQDKAWGDGEIFADYRCSPGVAVDRYKEGHRYRVLISLRETKNKGDEETIDIERTILNGFTQSHEDWQTEVDHRMHKLSISVIFPQRRPPKKVDLVEQNITRTTPLGPRHFHTLPDGRCQVTWKTNNPKTYEAYILAWEW
jgi:hypothetical protein